MSFIQVGSWNIEHLSGASREEKRQSVYALADHIELAGIDVLALQEVYVTDPDEDVRLFPNYPVISSRAADGGRRNGDLDQVCYLLEEHLGSEWTYTILPNRNVEDRSQLCALLWNTSRVKKTSIKPLDVQHSVDGDALWDRRPHAVTFASTLHVWRRGGDGRWEQQEETKSFVVVPIHMKSNYGGATINRRKRGKEAETLVAALNASGLDPSIILIGDTNVLKYDEPAITTLVEGGFVDLNNFDSPTYWSKRYGDSPFDRAFVAAGREEFKYTRQYVLRSADLVEHDEFLSDHFMIKVSIKTYLDDSDPRDDL